MLNRTGRGERATWEISTMEIVTPPCTCNGWRAWDEPIMFYQHRSFVRSMVDLDEQRYTWVRRPLVLDRSGEPLTLKVRDSAIGSIVRIHAC